MSVYRFQIDLSDIDRNLYEKLDFRVALHPSESFDFLLTRTLAYALNFQEGLNFSAGGLSDPDAPCMSVADPKGGLALTIDIGNPSARRMHRAAKASTKVRIYTYKNPQALLKEVADVYNTENIELFALAADFLAELESILERDNSWSVVYNEGSLLISAGDQTVEGTLSRLSIP